MCKCIRRFFRKLFGCGKKPAPPAPPAPAPEPKVIFRVTPKSILLRESAGDETLTVRSVEETSAGWVTIPFEIVNQDEIPAWLEVRLTAFKDGTTTYAIGLREKKENLK